MSASAVAVVAADATFDAASHLWKRRMDDRPIVMGNRGVRKEPGTLDIFEVEEVFEADDMT
jgi:hypothetical protein